MVKEMQEGDCGESDAKTGLWGKGCKERYKDGTVGKGMQGEIQGGDCGERDARRGLWGKGCKEGTVGKEIQEGTVGKWGLW